MLNDNAFSKDKQGMHASGTLLACLFSSCCSGVVLIVASLASAEYACTVWMALFMMQEIALSDNRQHLDELPARARETLLSVVAAYIPYYNPPQVMMVMVMAGSSILPTMMGRPCVWCNLSQLPRLLKRYKCSVHGLLTSS